MRRYRRLAICGFVVVAAGIAIDACAGPADVARDERNSSGVSGVYQLRSVCDHNNRIYIYDNSGQADSIGVAAQDPTCISNP
jgi:hypothetical protein